MSENKTTRIKLNNTFYIFLILIKTKNFILQRECLPLYYFSNIYKEKNANPTSSQQPF